MAKVVDGKVILGSAQEWPDGLTWEAVIRWVEAGKGRFPRAKPGEPVQPALPWSVCKRLMGLDRDREHGTYSAPASEIAAIVTPLGFTFPTGGTVTIDEGWFMALVVSEYMQSPVLDNLAGSCSTDTEPLVCQGPWVQRVLNHLAGCIA